MTAVSGQYGKIMSGASNITECSFWAFDRTAAEHAYASCSTGGYKKRVPGTKDGGGSLKGYYDPTDPVENYITEGASVTLKLYVSTTKFYSVPAIINKLHIETDIEEGAPIPWEAEFGINGAWTLPT